MAKPIITFGSSKDLPVLDPKFQNSYVVDARFTATMQDALIREQRERAAPKSDTPPLRELPGQGRCVGYIVAQRAWDLNLLTGNVQAIVYGAVWQPGEPLRAVDDDEQERPLIFSAGGGNGAGIYAMKLDREITLNRWKSDPKVAGLVALWGRIKEHEHGYRAEWAYPLHFQQLSFDGPFSDAILTVLNDRYGCRPHKERVRIDPKTGSTYLGTIFAGHSKLYRFP